MPSSHESEATQQRASDAPPERDELSAQLADLEDKYRRARADLDNYRKRTAQDIERRVAEATEQVLRDWLETLDSVERAVRIESEGPCSAGLRAVLDQMEGVLAREGAHRIGAAGDEFDPERHEAIAVQPSDEVPDRTILAVERSGFALGDRVIRPAQVVVARTSEHAR
jgi:molecular chaperone GrpE